MAGSHEHAPPRYISKRVQQCWNLKALLNSNSSRSNSTGIYDLNDVVEVIDLLFFQKLWLDVHCYRDGFLVEVTEINIHFIGDNGDVLLHQPSLEIFCSGDNTLYK